MSALTPAGRETASTSHVECRAFWPTVNVAEPGPACRIVPAEHFPPPELSMNVFRSRLSAFSVIAGALVVAVAITIMSVMNASRPASGADETQPQSRKSDANKTSAEPKSADADAKPGDAQTEWKKLAERKH